MTTRRFQVFSERILAAALPSGTIVDLSHADDAQGLRSIDTRRGCHAPKEAL